MIRPLTILTCLLACGSGLYLYQSKHEVQVLDRTIEKTVRETTALREQSRLLSAEWTMLNDPERLRQFSDTYLNLKSINPAQFTSLADLNGRLPEIQIAAPEPVAPESTVPVADAGETEPVAAAEGRQAEPAEAEAAPAMADALPLPPVPVLQARSARASVAAVVAHQQDVRLAAARPAAAEVQPRSAAEAHPAEPRTAAVQHQTFTPVRPFAQTPVRGPAPIQAAAQSEASGHSGATAQSGAARPIVLAAPRLPPANRATGSQMAGNQTGGNRPAIAYRRPGAPQAAETQQQPYGGSLLGMARGSMPPAPRPTPVNATYNTN